MNFEISPTELFRLPWNLADNSISWLEPTSKCNLSCDGCYRENRINSHKTLSEIEYELNVFQRLRKTDSISITGGEPLTHPNIIDIVRMIKKRGWKPVINTNGALLDKDFLVELKKAGAFGFTFHIDSFQNRPGWKGKNEIELNELRLHYANMLKEVGGLSCAFNATVYPENLAYIPNLVRWAQEHIDKVHIMVFIIYRMAIFGRNFDFYVGDKRLETSSIHYIIEDNARRTDITSNEVVSEIRKLSPDFNPSAFLNGTIKPDSYKWLLAGRLGNKHQIFGYTGPKFMELVQNIKHFFTGTYLAYANPKVSRMGRMYFPLAIFDNGLKEIIKNYFQAFLNKPLAFFSRVHYQSVLIIQPIDFLENGDLNMCDGCPDMTVWKNELVWSCRLEEQLKYGQNVRAVKKKEQKV